MENFILSAVPEGSINSENTTEFLFNSQYQHFPIIKIITKPKKKTLFQHT